MITFDELISKEEKIAVIGLGYVGFPLLIELAKTYDVIGFDTNEQKVEQYKQGIDVTQEVGNELTKQTTAHFTANEKDLQQVKVHLVAVPTPINQDKTPDLTPIIEASKMIGRNLTKGSIIVFESTVYPGTTEEVCVPTLEEYSGLTFGEDFKVGYSPERINPGDKVNTLTKITKVVSGSDEEALQIIYEMYDAIIEAGVHQAPTIKVAEAAKVIENAQRDINIAFMNELSIVFNMMNIDTNAVLEAANTKWNFLNFTPGLVGGHCIGVDPYYFLYKAEQLGYHSQIIAAGRKINDKMGGFVATNVIKEMIRAGKKVKGSTVAVLGITFKENVPDVRNTKVIDVIEELKDFEVNVLVHDPVADEEEVQREFNLTLVDKAELNNVDAVILTVSHDEYLAYTVEDFNQMYKNEKIMYDVRGALNKNDLVKQNYKYKSL